MAEFVVTAQEVKNKALELHKINADFKKDIEELEAEHARIGTMWEGEAHDSYDAAFKKNKVHLTNLYNAIENYCAKLDEIAVNYATAELKNASLASGQE